MGVGRSRAREIISCAPVILLVAVALNQLRLVDRYDLVPWKGGGFGMFSTNDRDFVRFLRVTAVGKDPGIEHPLAIPPEARDLENEVTTIPNPRRMRELGDAVLRHYDVRMGSLRGLRVELWRVDFDHESLEMSRSLVRTAFVEAPEQE